MKRNRKYCKYYKQRGAKTAYCMFLGKGLQCYKVCNMYVETRANSALNIADVSDYVCPKCGGKHVVDWFMIMSFTAPIATTVGQINANGIYRQLRLSRFSEVIKTSTHKPVSQHSEKTIETGFVRVFLK